MYNFFCLWVLSVFFVFGFFVFGLFNVYSMFIQSSHMCMGAIQSRLFFVYSSNADSVVAVAVVAAHSPLRGNGQITPRAAYGNGKGSCCPYIGTAIPVVQGILQDTSHRKYPESSASTFSCNHLSTYRTLFSQ